MPLLDDNIVREAVLATIERLIRYPYGSNEFNVTVLVVFISMFIVGRVVCSVFGGSPRGFILCGCGLCLPVLVGIVAYSISPIFLEKWIPEKYLFEALPLILAIGFGILALLLITPFILGIGLLRAILVTFVTIALAACAVYVTWQLTDLLGYAEAKVNNTKMHYREVSRQK